MSAVAMVIQDDCIILAGDGAASHLDGRLWYYCSKLHHMPEYSAVFAATGLAGLNSLFWWFRPEGVHTFDGLIDGLGDHMQSLFQRAEEWGWIEPGLKSNIAIGGYSEKRQRFEGWRMATYDKQSFSPDGSQQILPAWQAEEVQAGRIWCSANIGRGTLERFGLLSEGTESNLDRLARVICAARAESGKIEGGDVHNVGGFLQLGILGADQYQSWIAHRWPEDVLGEPVNPARGQPLPDHLMPLPG